MLYIASELLKTYGTDPQYHAALGMSLVASFLGIIPAMHVWFADLFGVVGMQCAIGAQCRAVVSCAATHAGCITVKYVLNT